MHPIGDRWRVVCSPGAGRGGWALLETRKQPSPEPGEKGALLSVREGKLGGARASGRERGCVFLGGVGIPLEGRRTGVRGGEGGLRGCYAGTG